MADVDGESEDADDRNSYRAADAWKVKTQTTEMHTERLMERVSHD